MSGLRMLCRLLALALALALLLGAGSARAEEAKPALGEEIGNRTYPTGSQSRQPGDPPCSNPFGCGRGTRPGQYAPGAAGAGNPSAAPAGRGGDVYCQQNDDGSENRGPYGGTGKQIPCKPRPAAGPRVVFNYYYINGINTPRSGEGRGTCLYDRTMIKGNLLDQGARVGPGQQVRPEVAPTVKLGDEVDRFEVETCNPSGADKRVEEFCAAIGPLTDIPGPVSDLARMFCAKAADIDAFRGRGIANGMAPGDVVEAFRQSLGLGFRDAVTGEIITGIEFTARQPEVAKLAKIITDKYAAEQAASRPAAGQQASAAPQAGAGQGAAARPAEKNFFIIIAHSQGNFFAEGVAYRLASAKLGGPNGKAVFQGRLGILSVASPTNYKSLDAGFIGRAMKHFTRADDGIHALDALAFLGSRVPWPAKDDLPRLWPWKSEAVMRSRMEIVKVLPGVPPALASPFFDTLGMSPPFEPCAGCGALYTPLMNAHLLDKYLTDPVAANTNVAINPRVAPLIGQAKPMSPAAPPVLGEIRRHLVDLKSSLMSGR
ncbi:MAG: hypothetical protein IT562_05060 [Alphaproteobacteria bacterium]|nr:hypothetical protein [Alphaproteobacteria bacterium]